MREKLIAAVVVLFGFTIAVLFAEVILRVLHKEPFDTENYFVKFERKSSANCVSTFDPKLGWTTESKVSGRENIYGTKVSTLEDGVRSNGDFVPPKDRRILAIGDSFTFGDEVSDEESWPAQLEKLKPDFHVLNAGVCGFGIDQAFLRAKQLVEKLKPEILLFSFIPLGVPRSEQASYGAQNVAAPKPYFVFKDGVLELKNAQLDKPKKEENRMDLFHKVFGYSHFFSALFVRTIHSYWTKPLRRVPGALSGEKGSEVACALMKELAQLSSSSNIKTLVIAQYGAVPEPKDLELSGGVLRCASDAGLAVLDMWPLQKKRRGEAPASYSLLFGAGHMTPAGNQWVAEQVARTLWP